MGALGTRHRDWVGAGRLIGVLAIVIAIGSAPVAGKHTARRSAAQLDSGLRAAVGAIARDHLALDRIPGLSIAIACGDELLLAEGYGLADVEHAVPVRPETVFRAGSITKQFTAAAVVRLEQRGTLTLGDELAHWVPGFDARGHTVRLHQLLTHTAGVPNLTEQPIWMARLRLDLDHDDVLRLVEGVPFDFAPGADWRYSNTGYYLLGMTIEAASGLDYAAFLRRELFEPLGLMSTRIERNTPLIPHRARGYQLFLGELRNAGYVSMQQPFAAGALASTASDLVRWQHALASGRVIGREGFERMATPVVLDDGATEPYGLGLALDELEGLRRVAHGGSIHGFRALLSYYPEQELSICVLANLEGAPVEHIERELARVALGLELLDLPLSPEELQRYAGFYEGEGWSLSVREREGELRARDRRLGPGRLLYQGGHEFRHAKDDRVRYVFEVQGDEAGAVRVERGLEDEGRRAERR